MTSTIYEEWILPQSLLKVDCPGIDICNGEVADASRDREWPFFVEWRAVVKVSLVEGFAGCQNGLAERLDLRYRRVVTGLAPQKPSGKITVQENCSIHPSLPETVNPLHDWYKGFCAGLPALRIVKPI